jgi:hypothetical protein
MYVQVKLTLNLLDLNSNIPNTNMFIIVDLQATFQTNCVYLYMVNLRKIFRIRGSNGYLVLASSRDLRTMFAWTPWGLFTFLLHTVHIVTYQLIARQRFDKHPAWHARNNRTAGLYNPFIGNGSVNTLPSRQWSHTNGQRPRDAFSVGPLRRFIGYSEGRLQSVIAEKPWVKYTKPSGNRD